MNPTQRNALWYGGFWLLLTLWLRLCLPECLMGWERHQLFRFSADYLTFFSTTPYPLLAYLLSFFAQFGLYPLLGAAVTGGLLVLGMGAWHRLSGRYWTGAVWAALMLPLIPYCHLTWVLVWLALLGGGLLINLRGLPTLGRLGVTAACALLGGLLLLENVVLAIAFWGVINGLRARSWQSGLYGLVAGLVGGVLGLGLAVGLGYPFVYTAYMEEWKLLRCSFFYMFPFPAKFFVCPLFLRIWLYGGLAVLTALPAVVLWPTLSRPFFKYMASVAAGLLLGGSAYLNLRFQVEEVYLVDRLAFEGRWAEAADAAELAFFRHARTESVSPHHAVFLQNQRQRARTLAGRCGVKPTPFHEIEEIYMADMLKICLLGSRQATDKLFAYNGSYYFPLLFPEEILYSVSSYMMALYDTQSGLYAEALHLLYDFVTSFRVSTAVLEPLLWNSVVVGDYAPCRKFIRFFEQSLFHKDIARRYSAYLADTAKTARQPDVAAARTKLSTRNHIVLGYFPDDNIYFRVQHEADNAAVYEYALMLWMIYKNHERLLAELPTIRQYYPVLPLHIQEAVLANFSIERLSEVPSDIDPAIKARYTAFIQLLGLYQNGYTSFKNLKKGFEDTYWYHLHFNEFKPINLESVKRSGEI